MSQERRSVADSAHHIGSREWMEPARQRRKHWGRKRIITGVTAGIVVGSVMFIVVDGPRQTGLTDALGLTCGEYVHPGTLEPSRESQVWRGSGAPQEVFEDWDNFVESVTSEMAEHADYDADTAETLLQDLRALGAEHGAEPVHGAFRGWEPNQTEFSAAPAGEAVVVGEHLEQWLTTDRLSLIEPSTGRVSVSVALEHPERTAEEDRQPVLRAVGAAEARLVLQTPTARGDTDIVVVSASASEDVECIRLEGGFAPSRYQTDFPVAWHSVMNLNQVEDRREHEFRTVHGRDTDTPGSEHRLSTVDLASGEAEPFDGSLQWTEDEPEFTVADFEARSFAELGEDHLFLDWTHGYVIYEKD